MLGRLGGDQESPAAVTGLGLLGIGRGEWKAPATEAPAAATQPNPQDVAAAVEELIGSLKREFQSLGMFQRQWYERTLKQRSGLGLDEWDSVSRASRFRSGA